MIQTTRRSARLAQIREAVERHREEFVLVLAVCEAANESTSLSDVLSEVTQMVCEFMGWPVGHAYALAPEIPAAVRPLDVWYLDDPERCGAFRAASEAERREAARELGLDHCYAVPIPIRSETKVVGGIEFFSPRPAAQAPARIDALLASIGTALGRVAERELQERQRHLLIRTELAREEAVQRAAELQRLASALHRRNRELDQFAYVASHDLRAPLRGIANLASWIAQDLDPHLTDETRRYLDLLGGRVSRMETLISGLLEYSRAGRRATPDELLDVTAMVREIIDLLETNAKVEWQIESLPRVLGPRVLLRQVFHNLLSNAVKYATVARPRIEIGAEHTDGVWRFFVRDNGPGIAACYQARIWEIFQTLQPCDDAESTGIGLSLVRKIVEQRGGEVGVDSAPGHGATFSFTWPEHASQPGPEQVPERLLE